MLDSTLINQKNKKLYCAEQPRVVTVVLGCNSNLTMEYNAMTENGITYIFRPYITIKGKRIYRKNGGMFKIPISNKKATGLANTVA